MYREFTTNREFICSDYVFYECPGGFDSALVMNRYGFLSENDIVFGWTYPGGYEEVQTVMMESDYMPFDKQYELIEDADGNVVYAGENFEITWKAESVTVKFRPSADSDVYEVLEIPYLEE